MDGEEEEEKEDVNTSSRRRQRMVWANTVAAYDCQLLGVLRCVFHLLQLCKNKGKERIQLISTDIQAETQTDRQADRQAGTLMKSETKKIGISPQYDHTDWN